MHFHECRRQFVPPSEKLYTSAGTLALFNLFPEKIFLKGINMLWESISEDCYGMGWSFSEGKNATRVHTRRDKINGEVYRKDLRKACQANK